MDELISKQIVLNEFCHSCDGWSCNPNTCCKTEWIRKLPVIQPERKECEEREQGNVRDIHDDMISRRAAIDAITDELDKIDHVPQWVFDKLERAIKQLPPIQPKRGKWNRLGRDVFNCNKCGATFDLNQGSEKMHFCPKCGADMREVTE